MGGGLATCEPREEGGRQRAGRGRKGSVVSVWSVGRVASGTQVQLHSVDHGIDAKVGRRLLGKQPPAFESLEDKTVWG